VVPEQVIVDYKTSRHEGADLEGFSTAERERCTPQLRAALPRPRAEPLLSTDQRLAATRL